MEEAAEPAEETVAGGSEQGETGEERLQEMSTTSGEDSRLPPAPDVTYDATVLEQNPGEAAALQGSGREESGERDARSGTPKEKAVRFKEEVAREDPPEEARGEGGGEDKRDMEEDEEKEEWMDILGSGDLKKKVRW